jgi:2-oxoisovalerate dehydrogenase E1 component
MKIEQYKRAKLVREFEQLLLKLFAQGKLNGTVHTCVGQELTPVVLSEFINSDDTFFSNHRGHGHYICKTNDIRGLLAEVMGRQTGCSGGYGGSQHLFKEKSFYSNGIQGGMTPIAAGYAFSKKINNKPGISIVFIGDGTLGEGTLYEAVNAAAVYKLPILFVLENNGYAQSTCFKQTSAGCLDKRFEGFGLKYVKANIWDDEDLSAKFEDAVGAARSCQPTLIEVECYRLNSHSKGDDNRDPVEISSFQKRDPINAFEEKHPDESQKVQKEIADLLTAILNEVENDPVLEHSVDGSKISSSTYNYTPLPAEAEAIRVNDAIYNAFRDAFQENSSMVILGEDIQNNNEFNPKPYGGAFKVTKDLSNLSPTVFNTPISEAAITGMGIGIALENESPAVAEIMFGDFMTLTLDQLLQHASKFQGMFGKKLNLPFILRTPMGGKRGYGPTHSQSVEKHFLGIYGLTILALNYRCNPYMVYRNLLKKVSTPTIVIENKIDYTRYLNTSYASTHDYFISDESFPTIKITPKSLKPQLTLFCYGGTLGDVEAAIADLFLEHEIAVEVICPVSLYPFNIQPLADSVKKTAKLITIEEGASFAALGSEVISQLLLQGIKLERVSQMGNNFIIPSSYTAELKLLPGKEKIINSILKMK